jgi:3-keto-disaccharide hydrolase
MMDTKRVIFASALFRGRLYAVLVFGGLFVGACHQSCPPAAAPAMQAKQARPAQPAQPAQPARPVKPAKPAQAKAAASKPAVISLFDGKTLGHWKITDFGGQGKVYVKDGAIYLEQGNDMTGVTWDGPVVRMNYEITLEAMRVSGSDFFCGLTFPVNNNYCSLILGGWGGTVCGLSNIDYYDAANNETTRMVSFENGKWYHVRLRVTPNRIQAWLAEEEDQLVDMDITGRKIDTRIEVDESKPLGIATWETTGAIRNIKLRKLTAQKAAKESDPPK